MGATAAMAIVGAVLGTLTSGANLAMTWVLGEQQIDSNTQSNLAKYEAEKQAYIESQHKRNNFLIIFILTIVILAIVFSNRK